MTRCKSHFATLRTQQDRKAPQMFNRPSVVERNAQIARLNSGQVQQEALAAAKAATEKQMALERERYEASEKARLAKREIELADAKFKSDIALAVRVAKNQLVSAVASRDIEAAKTAAQELLILERISQ